MKLILGIDPGLSGGLAFYEPELHILETHEMPVIKAGVDSKRVIDEVALARLIDNRSEDIRMAVVEHVSASPQMGVTSAFTFGQGFGTLKGVLAANFIPITLVRPNVWKKDLAVPKAKDGAVARATQLFPRFANQWPRKKDDGKAEAALIAYYGHKMGAF